MIPSIYSSSLSFGANNQNPVRDLYNAHISTISQTAQTQKNATPSPSKESVSTLVNPIPMQGTGQKLDVIA